MDRKQKDRTFDLGYKVQGSAYQKERRIFKGYSCMEGQPIVCQSAMTEEMKRKVLSC